MSPWATSTASCTRSGSWSAGAPVQTVRSVLADTAFLRSLIDCGVLQPCEPSPGALVTWSSGAGFIMRCVRSGRRRAATELLDSVLVGRARANRAGSRSRDFDVAGLACTREVRFRRDGSCYRRCYQGHPDLLPNGGILLNQVKIVL